MNAVKQEESNMIDIDVKVEYLMDIKREEGYFDELNENGEEVGGDDVGGGGVVVKEEEVEEEVEEVAVGLKRKAEEETEPKEMKKKRVGNGYVWTEEEDDALLKGVGKYGLDWKRIREDNVKVLADRNPVALRQRLLRQYPEKNKELRAANPRYYQHAMFWTSEEDAALKRGRMKHGTDWKNIQKSEKALGRRTPAALKERYSRNLRK
ncbi:hypothetical protein TrST_g3755 [Triparma strigata]|uniref:Myb-like domain-containing protein n=1 Tax=Triparma strigata TaxID=1606541 RepID=A0A9W7EMV3_9STRA|nr:hypothetical protein TrST_g3755 [Triparma strigata]